MENIKKLEVFLDGKRRLILWNPKTKGAAGTAINGIPISMEAADGKLSIRATGGSTNTIEGLRIGGSD
jgi:hypothetical protein